MLEIINTLLLWALNIAGLILWAYVLMLSIESFGHTKFSTWKFWKDWRYWINWIWLISAFCVVMYRVDDMWMQKTMNYIWIRSIASILVPIGISLHYLLKGVKSSVIQATRDFWNGKDVLV